MLANPRYMDDFNLLKERHATQYYPPIERTSWRRDQNRSLDTFIMDVVPGSRVLFEYTGHVALSPFRNILSIMEAQLYDRNVELLPHELTFYSFPHFSYDISCHLSPGGDLDIADKTLRSCGISYVMIYSVDLLNTLLHRGYKLMSELKLDTLRGFIPEERIPVDRIWVLYTGEQTKFCNDRSVVLERQPNRMLLRCVQAGREYIIYYRYHSDWQASQDVQRLTIKPIDCCGLDFMSVKAINDIDIAFKFGSINHIIR